MVFFLHVQIPISRRVPQNLIGWYLRAFCLHASIQGNVIGHVGLSVCLSACLSACLSVCGPCPCSTAHARLSRFQYTDNRLEARVRLSPTQIISVLLNYRDTTQLYSPVPLHLRYSFFLLSPSTHRTICSYSLVSCPPPPTVLFVLTLWSPVPLHLWCSWFSYPPTLTVTSILFFFFHYLWQSFIHILFWYSFLPLLPSALARGY